MCAHEALRLARCAVVCALLFAYAASALLSGCGGSAPADVSTRSAVPATISVQLSNRPAPYTIGYTFFASLRDQAGFDRVLEIRRFYEDVSLIDLVLTDELVRRLDIFVYDPKEKQKSYDLQKVKEMLIAQKLYKGEPRIEVDPASQGRDLLLAHLDEDRKLEPKRVNLFLRAVYSLWRNPVKLRANGKVYTYDRRGLSST